MHAAAPTKAAMPAPANPAPPPDLDAIRAALDTVPDPEIPVVSIRELGILRELREADDGLLEIVITPTYSGCPAMSQIAEDIEAALARIGAPAHRIVTVLSPAWTTDWISEAARDKLRTYGIAPPVGNCGSPAPNPGGTSKVIRFAPKPSAAPACPRCGSVHTERLAQFASTACKALYRCLDCREPFDYFKPY
ncbi:1,2-phenylacetyl-CoA epoxidase subunit PaaD [Burkholderia gladioli]|uniref:1,2-phenylacetyl-CoA epoxidase subunit PaaD n=1 Tax=Burkholderia gladioli TaxID=28095 RepID=UPI0016417454